MSISVDLLKELESSTYISNGTQIVNINGPRGFSALVNIESVYTGSRPLAFNTLSFDNLKFNLSDQIKLNPAGNLVIEPANYTRTLMLFVNIITGGLSSPSLTNFQCYVTLPAGESSTGQETTGVELCKVQHQQTTAWGKGFYQVSFVIPKNAYNFECNFGTYPGTTSIFRVKVYGILSA